MIKAENNELFIDTAAIFGRLTAPPRPGEAELLDVKAELAHVEGRLLDLHDVLAEAEATLNPPAPPGQGPPRNAAARDLMKQDPLFIDYETTGLRRKDYAYYEGRPKQAAHQIIEVGVINSAGYVLYHSHVNPGRPVPPKIWALTGLSPAEIEHAPPIEEIYPELEKLLKGRTICAHNAKFEKAFTPPSWDITWACSMALADETWGKFSHWDVKNNPLLGSSLSARLARCNIKTGPQHSALGDCLNCLKLIKYMAGDNSPVDLIY